MSHVKLLRNGLVRACKASDQRHLFLNNFEPFKDCTIQVTIHAPEPGAAGPPKAKRAKPTPDSSPDTTAGCPSTPTPSSSARTIRAHAVILASKSKYFRDALTKSNVSLSLQAGQPASQLARVVRIEELSLHLVVRGSIDS